MGSMSQSLVCRSRLEAQKKRKVEGTSGLAFLDRLFLCPRSESIAALYFDFVHFLSPSGASA